MLWFIIALVASYLVGGFPTAIVAGKVLRGIDIRDYGSGNAGATNVWRVLGAGPAIGVLAVDAGKGALAVLALSRIGIQGQLLDLPSLQVLCGLMAIVGHVWTPFARFRGGKGVGTALGVFGALAPWSTLTALIAFVIVVATTRYISAGSITAAAVLPATMIVQRIRAPGSIPMVTIGAGLLAAALVIFTHRSNIRRLKEGTENRFGRPASAKPPE